MADLPIRSSILRGLPERIAAAGGDSVAFLAKHGFSEGEIIAGDVFVSHQRFECALEDAARTYQAPALGLELAAGQELGILDELALAMKNSPTLGDSLRTAAGYLHRYSPTIALRQIPDPDGTADAVGFRYTITTRRAGDGAQAIDYGIGIVHRFLYALNGNAGYGLLSVNLPHEAIAGEQAYRRFFRADVRFNESSAVLRLSRASLNRGIAGGDLLIHELAMERLSARSGGHLPRVTDLVSTLIDERLGRDSADLPALAAALDLHPRALQRLLTAEGATTSDLLDEVRRTRCRHLLTETDLPMIEVALSLGFQEQSSLTRAAHRWFATSPSELRQRSRAQVSQEQGDPLPEHERWFGRGPRDRDIGPVRKVRRNG